MSAYEPKRTKAGLKSRSAAGWCVLSLVAAQEGIGPLDSERFERFVDIPRLFAEKCPQ